MNAQPRRTATGLPDMPDQPSPKRPVEEMQEEYLIEHIGIEIYAALKGTMEG